MNRAVPSPPSLISSAASTWLDALRAFLVAQVVLGHLAAIALPTLPELAGWSPFAVCAVAFRLTTRFGPQAAYLFVFLSGFLVGGALLRDRLDGRRLNFRSFAARRMTKIMPVLAGALVLSAVLDLTGAFLLHGADLYRRQNYDYFAAITPVRFLGNLLSLQPTLVGVFGSNGPLWTLGYIVQFYFAGFAAIRWLSRRNAAPFAFALLLAAWLRPEWLCLFLIWTLGAAARVSPNRPASLASALVLGAALIVLANRLPVLPSILTCGFAGIFLVTAAQGAKQGLAGGARRATQGLASLSFEVYAVHYPIAFFIFASLVKTKAQASGLFLAFLVLTIAAISGAALLVRRLSPATLRLGPAGTPA
ncbi:acyltransferase family protein [Rhodoblastus acidophilus]|uniref:Acyltransferase family protein n=1 Tax=Candidatus Rhodoblastus alkanivorans TaxID=2954117 RepID=A0ABS9Z9I6_9HYPH|nr:acyltransferase family protein [Candidatus Rhodoblastus alkanivorans]MCI4679536.1 acyltransferase family protein [Candidatus Rhodoblastus alkanivorans]MCI4683287.1 acyltransferase family protein [Candidatus Rhodoblastus alkanivorans]MDI4640599.1 acyltransferase family protein [Rhodoblastus acidophilus]